MASTLTGFSVGVGVGVASAARERTQRPPTAIKSPRHKTSKSRCILFNSFMIYTLPFN